MDIVGKGDSRNHTWPFIIVVEVITKTFSAIPHIFQESQGTLFHCRLHSKPLEEAHGRALSFYLRRNSDHFNCPPRFRQFQQPASTIGPYDLHQKTNMPQKSQFHKERQKGNASYAIKTGIAPQEQVTRKQNSIFHHYGTRNVPGLRK